MNKICTDINQSEKLIKLGIDVITADMCHRYRWSNNSFLILPCAEKAREPITGDIPAWSLAALLGLTPNDVSLLHLEDVYQAVYDVKPYHITNRCDNPIDAAFEMVVWLKENEKI